MYNKEKNFSFRFLNNICLYKNTLLVFCFRECHKIRSCCYSIGMHFILVIVMMSLIFCASKEIKNPTHKYCFFPNLTPCHIGLTGNILWLEAMMLKEEKNERLNIKSDPPVQVNAAASCSKSSFIGSTHPFLWSAISNHALVDKCTLVSFSFLLLEQKTGQ